MAARRNRTERVDSLADVRLAPFVNLRDRDLARAEEGLCVVEGALAVEALLDSPFSPHTLFVSEERAAVLQPLIAKFPGLVLVGSADLLKATVGFTLHRGVIAVAERNVVRSADDVIAGATRLLVLEGINDIENLGALFRNAAAFSVDGVLLDPTTADPLYRRTIRVSLGHALRVPYARFAEWPGPLRDLAGDFDVLALTPNAPAPDLRTLVGSLAPRVALVA
ncbi:MAG TPA: RNA methyltransferase, partial [Acidimicrobiales bacterium]|nr:RNA methyltransferase [Acidimicrobiales bacterium]